MDLSKFNKETLEKLIEILEKSQPEDIYVIKDRIYIITDSKPTLGVIVYNMSGDVDYRYKDVIAKYRANVLQR